MWNPKLKFLFNLLDDLTLLELTMEPSHPETCSNPASDFHLQACITASNFSLL